MHGDKLRFFFFLPSTDMTIPVDCALIITIFLSWTLELSKRFVSSMSLSNWHFSCACHIATLFTSVAVQQHRQALSVKPIVPSASSRRIVRAVADSHRVGVVLSICVGVSSVVEVTGLLIP